MDRYDIKFDGDLIVVNNDVVWDLSDTQHVQDTINAVPGWWKEHFWEGVNIRSYLNSSQQERVIARSIKINLESDLYICANPKVYFTSDSKMIVEPNATI
jgi:hypothetical protein